MIVDLALGLLAGAMAGGVFFGGLQWTLSRLITFERVVFLAVSSFLVRSAVSVGLLVVVADGRLSRLLAAVAGILVVRTILVARAHSGLDVAKESSWT